MDGKCCVVIFAILVHNSSAVANFMQVYTKIELSKENNELPELLYYITTNYLFDCVPYVLYDEFFYETHLHKDALFKTLDKLKTIPLAHGFIEKFNISHLYNIVGRQFCFHFVIFSNDEEVAINKLDFQLTSKVVVVSTFSRYQLNEFLASSTARNIMNLLIISDPLLAKDDYRTITFKDINLFTHKLHVDGIGSSRPKILTSWRNTRLTRPDVNLFPPKLDDGFHGHQFIVAVFDQPPFVYRRKQLSSATMSEYNIWDGNEVRMLKMIGQSLNFGLNILSLPNANETTGAEEVISLVHEGKADFGISGLYITRQHYDRVHFSMSHVQDCAVFITLSSTAIPKYRAILGPFQWGVWICIIFIYLAAVIPLSFCEKLSWKKMFENCAEIGHMFWMVFGTFTNLFTFKGDRSWNISKKNSTCITIGTYWVFTIIITAAYSSSIISFITIPTYFDVVDNIDDLLDEEYHIGVTDSRDWKVWFNDTTDYKTNKLLKNLDVVNTTDLGILKVKKKEKYALLGSEHQLIYIVRTNFTSSSKKKSMFHIASQCLAPFMVSIAMKKKSDFLLKVDQQIQRLQENGLLEKIRNDLDWEIARKSKGRLFTLGANALRTETPEDRQLTVDDMQGMFLLLCIGLSFAGTSLLRECWYGYQCCEKARIRSRRTTPSIPSIRLTPCEDTGFKGSQYLRKFSAVYQRTVSASISMSEYITERVDNARRFSH